MKAVIQKVQFATVTVQEREVSRIEAGLLVYIGIGSDDEEPHLRWMAEKIATLRVFPEGERHFHLNVSEVHGHLLVVSQFTLYGDIAKGRRPDFAHAMEAEKARVLFERFVELLRERSGVEVRTGEFQAHMLVSSVNDGPVTLLCSKEGHT